MLVHQLTIARKALDNVSNYQGLEFAYAVLKNKQLIDIKLMEVDFIKNVSPEVIEYEEKRVKVCEQYTLKDDNDLPIIENDLYKIGEQDEFKKKMDELLEEYKTPIIERQKQIEIFNNKMNEIVDIQFIKINKIDIPLELKTARELEEISFMIE